MRAITASLGLAALAALAAAQATPPALGFADGTPIKADLNIEIDSGAAQVGDQITVTLTDAVKQGKTSLPKGTILTGKVTQAAPAKDAAGGQVAVLFDRADTPKGNAFSLLAGIASVKLPAASSLSRAPGGGGRSRRGGYPGGGYPGGGYPSGGGYPAPSGSAAAPPSAPVFRFPADAAKIGSVISTSSGDLVLGPGSKVVLQVIAPAAKSGI